MDKELFEKKLSEVAEWEIPKVSQSDIIESTRRSRKGKKDLDDEFQEDDDEPVLLDLVNGVNPTITAELTKVKICATICDDCGKVCPNGRRKDVRLVRTARLHWRERCLTCNMGRDPYTGQFNLTPQEYSLKWNSFMKYSSNIPPKLTK